MVKVTIDDTVYASQVLTERLKTETKKILSASSRYKVVVCVVITPKFKQSMQICSRCMWETEYDTEINEVYENKDLQAVTTIYCVYTP